MIINNSNFKIKEIPDFHPIAESYERDEWWRIQKRRCMEGYWVSGKWMPPELYYYINFHNILFEDGIYRGMGLPWLRDIDWEKAYIYAEATGFSGFELDDEYTCHRFIKENVPDERILKFCTLGDSNKVDKSYLNNFYKKDGSRKTYVEARDYLRKIHLGNLGKPLYFNEAQHIIELASRGYGKDLEDNTLVYTQEGAVPIKNIKVGDFIYGADGKLTKVLYKKSFNNQMQYKITFADGRTILCGGGHLWTVYDKFKHLNDGKVTIDTITIFETYKAHVRKKHNGNYNFDSRYFVQLNKGYEGKDIELPIDPYYLGLWLGDGSSSGTGVTTKDSEISDYIFKIAKQLELKVQVAQNIHKTCPTYNINSKTRKKGSNKLLNALKELNLIKNKHIPSIYFKASFNQRLELLKGLLDSDGYISNKNIVEFSSSIHKLAEDVINLSRGLGIRTSFSTRIPYYKKKEEKIYGKKNYRIFLKPTFNIFNLTRKKEIFSKLGSYSESTHNKIAIKNVEKVKVMPSTCITVDNKDKLFIAGDYIVTHNSYYASGLIAHNFIFDGARDYDLHLRLRQEGKPLQTDTVVGAIDAKYSNKLIGKVKVALEKLPGSKFVNMHGEQVYFPSPLAISYTGSFAIGREATATNSKSVVQHVTFADNPLAAAGGRPNKVFIDEVGFMNVIKEAWEGIENTQASADFKRLTIYGMGTGGLTVGGAVTYLQEIFYNPEAYGCLAFDDKWENKGKIGYFVPGTMALNQFKEGPNLITNEEKALEYINAERDKAKKSKSSTKMQGTIINKPIVPSEIFLRMEGTYFPTHELKQALAELESNKLLLRASYKAELIEPIKNVIKLEPSEKQVITEYPMKRGQSMDAPVEIFEKPKLDTDGHVFDNRYIASCLPPGEKVLTDKGLKNVEDITFKSKLVNKDGNYVEINKLIRHDLKDENIYELKVANTYRKTKFTSEHPILVSKEKTGYVSYPRSVRLGINQRYKKFDFKFKQISEITEGEWIKVPNIYKKLNDFDITELWDNNTYRIDRQIENPLNKEAFWWFVGIWLGDGWCNKNGYTISVCFNEKEEQYINKFKKVVSTLFNRKVSIVSNPGSKTLIFNHQQLNRFLTKHFGKYAIGKNLPEWSKKIDISLKRNLILGYLDSDGSILKNKDYWSTEFVSISLNLLEGFQDVLFSLGIISSITKLRNERKADICGIMCNIQKTYHLRIGHGDSLKLKELLNKPKNLKLSRIIKEELPILTKRTPIINCFLSDDNNYIYFKIEKIVKSKYTGTVYNFECDTHTFMCHHITTHNCDPVDDDGNSDITRSLQSAFVLDTWTNKIVAEYTARTYLVDEYYENLRKLIVYYNAKLLYEANKKGLYGYFKNKNSLYLLNEVPEILKDQDLIKSVGIGNRSLGVNVSNDKIKFYAINLILKWLESPSYNNPDKKNLYTIRSLGLLKELISFSMAINADRCVLKDTEIQTINGIKKIQELNVGDKVLTQSGKYNPVYLAHKNNFSGRKVSIRALGDYRELICTDNHPIFIKKYKKKPAGIYWMQRKYDLTSGEFINAENVQKGDFIFIPKRTDLNKQFLPEDLLYLLGWYISDGNASNTCSKVSFFFQYNQKEIAKDIVNILNKYFKKEDILVKKHVKKGTIVNEYRTHKNNIAKLKKGYKSNMWVVDMFSKELNSFVKKYGGKANNKRIHEKLYNTENLLPLLRGFFEGDGHYRSHIRTDGTRRSNLELSSIYKELMLQIRQILLDNGIWNTIRFVKKRNTKHKDQYNINISGNKGFAIVKDSKKFDQVFYDTNNQSFHVEEYNGFYVPVKEVKIEEFEGTTYNISVENDETYVANGILTHNCSSLMILMIFREELDRRIEQRKQTSVKSAAQSDFWGRAYGSFNKDKVHRKLKYLANYDVN